MQNTIMRSLISLLRRKGGEGEVRRVAWYRTRDVADVKRSHAAGSQAGWQAWPTHRPQMRGLLHVSVRCEGGLPVRQPGGDQLRNRDLLDAAESVVLEVKHTRGRQHEYPAYY